jgi:hypothetical protein
MSWSEDGDGYDLARFTCTAVGADSALQVVPDSFSYDPSTRRFWLQLTDGDSSFVVLGEDRAEEVPAVLVTEARRSYFDDAASPPSLGGVDDRDLVGLVLFHTTE